MGVVDDVRFNFFHFFPYVPQPADHKKYASTAIVLWEHPFDRVLDRWLGRVDVPTLLVWGDDDQLIPPGQAKTWAKLLPNATIRVFPLAGHLVLDESPEAAAAVAEFCA